MKNDMYPQLPNKFYLDITNMVIPADASKAEIEFWKNAPKILPICKNLEFGTKNHQQFLLVENECDAAFVKQARKYSFLRFKKNFGVFPRVEYQKRNLGFNHIPDGAEVLQCPSLKGKK